MFKVPFRKKKVTLVVYCETCGKVILKEKYAANRTEEVRVASICDACLQKAKDRDASGWD